jgi:Flp pilus assembly protein TadG
MKRLNRESGQALVEFALTILAVIFLILGFLELIFMFYTYVVLADSAKEGVRYAIVHGANSVAPLSGPTSGGATSNPPCTTSSTNIALVQAWVTQHYAGYSLHDPGAMTVDVCYFDGDNKTPHRVGVTVHYPYQPLFGLGWPTITVNAAADGRIMY